MTTTNEKRTIGRSGGLQRISCRAVLGACVTLILLGTPTLRAAESTVTVYVKNSSSYTIYVTVAGYRGTTASAILGPGAKTWGAAVRTNDGQALITAATSSNSISTRAGNNATRTVGNDRRPGYILWLR